MRRMFALGFTLAMLTIPAGGQSLVGVHGKSYRSALALVSRGPAADILLGPTTEQPRCLATAVHVPAGGAVYLYDFIDRLTCAQGQVVQLQAPPGVDSFVDVFFDDGSTRSAFSVGQIGELGTGKTLGPVVSDATQGTWLNLLPDAHSWLTVEVLDGSGRQAGLELFECDPPACQREVRAKPGVCYLRVSPGWPGFPSTARVSGFATTGKRDGGSDRVLELK